MVEATDTGVRLLLVEGGDAQVVLHRGVAANVTIHRFEIVEPSLHEIFVRHAGSDAAGDVGLPAGVSANLGGVA